MREVKVRFWAESNKRLKTLVVMASLMFNAQLVCLCQNDVTSQVQSLVYLRTSCVLSSPEVRDVESLTLIVGPDLRSILFVKGI